MAGTYTYEPAMITSYGKDRMRFELGDVMVDGKERTCALSDEEYIVLCDDVQSAKDWKRAKLKCLESIFRRFSFEPDTTVGPTSFKFGDRAKLWQEEYEKLKASVSQSCLSAAAISAQGNECKKPYFYTGMMSTEREGG